MRWWSSDSYCWPLCLSGELGALSEIRRCCCVESGITALLRPGVILQAFISPVGPSPRLSASAFLLGYLNHILFCFRACFPKISCSNCHPQSQALTFKNPLRKCAAVTCAKATLSLPEVWRLSCTCRLAWLFQKMPIKVCFWLSLPQQMSLPESQVYAWNNYSF